MNKAKRGRRANYCLKGGNADASTPLGRYAALPIGRMHAPGDQHPSPDNGRPVLFLCQKDAAKRKSRAAALLEIVSTYRLLID
jgi:hypothetical protein